MAASCARIGMLGMLLGVLGLAPALVGCAGQTYRTTVPELDARIESHIRLNDQGTLVTETEAGGYGVKMVQLRTGDGALIEPTVTSRGPEELRGGVNLGVGVGGYDGGVGVGTGVGRNVGGRIMPGPLIARFNDPPRHRQPWALRITLDTDPEHVLDLRLGQKVDAEPTTEPDRWVRNFDSIETWKLPDGTKRRFYTKANATNPRYEPAP